MSLHSTSASKNVKFLFNFGFKKRRNLKGLTTSGNVAQSMMLSWLDLNSMLSIAAKPDIEEPFLAMMESWKISTDSVESESEAKVMMKSESENHSYPVGGDSGLPYLPLVVTEVATDKEMIILNKL